MPPPTRFSVRNTVHFITANRVPGWPRYVWTSTMYASSLRLWRISLFEGKASRAQIRLRRASTTLHNHRSLPGWLSHLPFLCGLPACCRPDVILMTSKHDYCASQGRSYLWRNRSLDHRQVTRYMQSSTANWTSTLPICELYRYLFRQLDT